MKKHAFVLLTFVLATSACLAQEHKAGGSCEGCEAIYESPVPFEKLKSFTLLPGTS